VAREQSILQMTVLGLKLNEHNYEFYQYNEQNSNWIPLKIKDSFWDIYTIPYGIHMNVITGTDNSLSYSQPQIMLIPSGEMTPFLITIISQSTHRRLQVMGEPNGMIVLKEIAHANQ
jgi:hypothetical protein